MLKLAANLSFLFTELPFLDRFAAASDAGFRAVEYMFPYDYDSDEIRRRLETNGLQQVLFNLPAGDWAAGERGIACHPGRRAEFRAGVAAALPLAGKLGVRQLNCLAGLQPASASDAECRVVMLDNLSFAAEAAAAQGIKLLIEPINSRIDMPGFWLDTPAKAMALIDDLSHPNLFLQYDVYHAFVMGEDVLASLPARLPFIAHLQIADFPGRHQPGSGVVPFAELFRRLAASDYPGWVGCEYRPLGETAESLAWAVALGGLPAVR
jgi:hydroxypyruvate isomerase